MYTVTKKCDPTRCICTPQAYIEAFLNTPNLSGNTTTNPSLNSTVIPFPLCVGENLIGRVNGKFVPPVSSTIQPLGPVSYLARRRFVFVFDFKVLETILGLGQYRAKRILELVGYVGDAHGRLGVTYQLFTLSIHTCQSASGPCPASRVEVPRITSLKRTALSCIRLPVKNRRCLLTLNFHPNMHARPSQAAAPSLPTQWTRSRRARATGAHPSRFSITPRTISSMHGASATRSKTTATPTPTSKAWGPMTPSSYAPSSTRPRCGFVGTVGFKGRLSFSPFCFHLDFD